MSKTRHTDAQIIAALKQVEASRRVEDVAREAGVSQHTRQKRDILSRRARLLFRNGSTLSLFVAVWHAPRHCDKSTRLRVGAPHSRGFG
jgi:hypothetical protein